MAKERLRLTAHSLSDGTIAGFVVQPEGEVTAMLMPEPGVMVSEIEDHDLAGPIDVERLDNLRRRNNVELTPEKGKLVRKPDEEAD